MREIIASIDIGSDRIKMVVGEADGEKINVLCAVDEESRGVKRGVIVEEEETEYALRKLLNKEEEMLGIRIKKAIVNINEESAEFKIGEATIDIDGEVSLTDINKALKLSTSASIKKGYEIVSVIPIMFKVDEQKTRIPKNMKGSKLYVRSVVIIAPKRDIYKTVKCLEHVGVETVDIMLGSFASYYSVKNVSLDSLTGVIIDCGSETTKIGVINKGIIVNNLVIPAGGINIDKDINFVYKLNEEDSKRIKENFALANKRNATTKDVEVLTNTLGEKIEINNYEVSEVAMSRVLDVLTKAKNEINYLTKKEISYIIIVGGLSEFKDISLSVESVFGKNASIGRIMVVGARDNKYSSCIGMIRYFKEQLVFKESEFSIMSEEEIDSIVYGKGHKNPSGESILGKVFGIFFDN